MEGQFRDKKTELDIKGRTNIKKAGDYNFKASAKFNGKGIEALSKRDYVDEDKSNFENYVSIKDVGKYELSGVVMHRTKVDDVNVGATGFAKVQTSTKTDELK